MKTFLCMGILLGGDEGSDEWVPSISSIPNIPSIPSTLHGNTIGRRLAE